MNQRDVATAYAGCRIAVGLLLLLFPGRLMRDIAGRTDRRTKALGRMLGTRDLVLGAGALTALRAEPDSGSRPAGGARPWMTYGALADATDAVAFVLAYRELPKRKRALLVLMAASGAGTGAYLVSTFGD